MIDKNQIPLFDSHLHIIDPKFPLVANKGYIPNPFTVDDYKKRTNHYKICGGAVVSGSFQAFDQSYLISALKRLGSSFVGVTQLPNSVSDQEILELKSIGVRAVRFNLYRGGSEQIKFLPELASRIYELADWHTELYVDAQRLTQIGDMVETLPKVSIDHLGLSKEGFPQLLRLVSKGVHVKASGFSRVNFDVLSAVKQIYDVNPDALMFGTDLPSTRAPIPYQDSDFSLIFEALDTQGVKKVMSENASKFYRVDLS